MTPEAKDFLDRPRDDLGDALKIMGIPLAKVAARTAYYAAFHAAEALIVERTGKVAKTHSGVRSAFASLLKEMAASDRELLTFLTQAYKFKEIGDYSVGRGAIVTDDDAERALSQAEFFVDRVSKLLDNPMS